MTTIKDYLESALQLIDRAQLERLESLKNGALHDASTEIREAARVLGIKLDYGKVQG